MSLSKVRQALTPFLQREYGPYISGRFIECGSTSGSFLSGDHIDVTDKFTGESVSRVHFASQSGIAHASDLSEVSFNDTVSKMTPFERRSVLDKMSSWVNSNRDDLAMLLAVEAGKPLRDSYVEVDRAETVFSLSAEYLSSETSHGTVGPAGACARTAGLTMMNKRYPSGPVLMITPFNFPLNLTAHKVGPAIAAGCSFVIKPSDFTPVSALVLGEALVEAGWPEDAVGVIPCSLSDAQRLPSLPQFATISFTGSPDVGWSIKADPGAVKKKVLLELGGNAPVIVDESFVDGIGSSSLGSADAAIDHAASRIAFGAFFQSGQSCVSVQRVFAHTSIYEKLASAVSEKAKAWSRGLGDPTLMKNDSGEDILMGPLISQGSAKRVGTLISTAVEEGASITAGGNHSTGGVQIEATVLTDLDSASSFHVEEAFGPVVSVEPYGSESSASADGDFTDLLARLNSSSFGLQAGVFTSRLDRAWKAIDTLQFGGVVVNDIPSLRADGQPYGGVKDSGVGREGVKYAVEEMSDIRCALIRHEI